MLGTAKTRRRQPQALEPMRLFEHEEGSCGLLDPVEGTPGLLFARFAPAERIEWYAQQLQRGTEFRILYSTSLVALDVCRRGAPIARITTSLNDPALMTLLAVVTEHGVTQLDVVVAGGTFEDSAYPTPVRRPLEVRAVSEDAITGESFMRRENATVAGVDT